MQCERERARVSVRECAHLCVSVSVSVRVYECEGQCEPYCVPWPSARGGPVSIDAPSQRAVRVSEVILVVLVLGHARVVLDG